MNNKTTTLYLVETSSIEGIGYFEVLDSFEQAKASESYFLSVNPNFEISIYKGEVLNEDIEILNGDYNEFFHDLGKEENLISIWTKDRCLYCSSVEFHHIEPTPMLKTLAQLL